MAQLISFDAVIKYAAKIRDRPLLGGRDRGQSQADLASVCATPMASDILGSLRQPSHRLQPAAC